jgi:molecular chaperone GrpE
MGRKQPEVDSEAMEQRSAEAPDQEAAGPLEDGDVMPANEETERLRTELAELQDRYLRLAAEMDNVRRRARLDVEDARKYGTEQLISELLPVMDNLGRALEAAEQTSDLEGLKSGVDLTRRQFADVLERNGVERIPAVGEKFDPNVHEAVSQVEPEDGQEAHQVVEELRAGYRLNDRVVRPAMVKVTAG